MDQQDLVRIGIQAYVGSKTRHRERGESRARAQHDILIRSLEKVTGEAGGENEGWKIKLIIFVGGTSGPVDVQTFNDNLKALQVLESKRNAMERFGLCVAERRRIQFYSYFARRLGERSDCQNLGGTVDEVFQGLDNFE